MDTATAFYPWYSFLGEQLRAFHIPAWNPHQFSGTPFAADPESGWMYLPAMLAFTLLPLETAARVHMLFHLAFAAVTTYALARTLGASVGGALVAGAAYAQTGFLQGHTVCCFAYSGVATWLPLLLLGAERGVRAGRWSDRGLWWGIGGLAFSQILAIWIGQGAYYATLVVGAYIAARVVPGGIGTPVARVGKVLLHGAGITLFGAALGAAGLVPRLEYNVLSNLPGGYPDAGAVLPMPTLVDWGIISDWPRRFLTPGFSYPGLSVIVLASAGIVLAAGTRRAGRLASSVPFFASLIVVVLILARYDPTPLHAAFGLLPGFNNIHARSPERALLALYLGPAILAGVATTALQRGMRPWLGAALAIVLLTAVTVDLHLAWNAQLTESLAGGGDYQLTSTDLAAYYAPTPAAQFLEARAASEQPFRYFGYAEHIFGGPVPYTLRWTDASITALEVNNRALVTGLDDIQGYNPLHLARYDELFSALNGSSQNYHHADVLPRGLSSPILDLLNVRYVIAPTAAAQDERPARLDDTLPVAYADSTVTVYERPSTLPRAWWVHAAQLVPSAASGRFVQGAGGAFDPRRVALLETDWPPLGQPVDLGADQVTVVSSAADRIELRAASSAAGLVVLSEVYYPAWHAYIDGQAAPAYIADGALRAVAVPAGEHAIEMRFESAALWVGVIISSVAGAALLALAARILMRATTQRDDVGEVRCESGAVPQL